MAVAARVRDKGSLVMTTKESRKLEDQIFQRLSQWQTQQVAAGAGAGTGAGAVIDRELVDLIYRFLYANLRQVAAVLPGMGQAARDVQQDASCRFT
ncbi:MAG: hypothetical protein ACKPJD_35965, partial [Planctomycetaceae bacterium]